MTYISERVRAQDLVFEQLVIFVFLAEQDFFFFLCTMIQPETVTA